MNIAVRSLYIIHLDQFTKVPSWHFLTKSSVKPGDSVAVASLKPRSLKVTGPTFPKGYVFTIPKRSPAEPAELPGKTSWMYITYRIRMGPPIFSVEFDTFEMGVVLILLRCLVGFPHRGFLPSQLLIILSTPRNRERGLHENCWALSDNKSVRKYRGPNP